MQMECNEHAEQFVSARVAGGGGLVMAERAR